MANIPASIYITHLEREGSFIKIWGQTDRSLPIAIEKALQQMTPHFEQGMYSPAIENFQVGIMCCAKFKDDLYYRARITNVGYLTQGMVEVLFVDYGNRDVIPCMNTRTMSGLQTGLISIPAQAKDFILANVTLHNWEMSNFEIICNELRYLEFPLYPVLEIGPYTLISLYLNKQDVTESLVERGLLLKIPIQFQQLTLQPVIARTTPPTLSVAAHHLPISMAPMQPKITPITQQIQTPTLLTYKALPLDNESEHQIYISYVSDGPCLFSVQLKKMEDQLKRLMTEINCMELQPLEEYPLPGTVCLAQSSEDGYICRAVVTSMVDGQYKVFYVDFGNTELLPFDKLFQIPFKYVIPKVMATRFALAGLENATVSIEMKCKFKEFVNNRPLFMKVKPAATKSALPLCELWDENNIKALDMIKQAALLSYPEAAPLSRGLNQDVKVTFVYSCNKIFVQLKSKENELKQLMENLQETCYSRPLFGVNDLKVGAPCCATFPGDSMWYRGEIILIERDSFKIKYIDFGNEDIVTYNDIKVPLPEYITALRPQAIECCLNGYQNIEPDEERDLLLEELILDQDLSMRVVEIQGSRALVDLYDKLHYNVASLLLEKIASATSMVSPLLIQDNHRIEHRKRSSPQGNYREFRDKKPLRELNDRNRQENWRQNKTSRSNNDNWNEQSQADKQDKFYKTNNRNSESDWEITKSPESKNSFHRENKRYDEQKGRNLASSNNYEQVDNNGDSSWDTKDNENKNFYPRGKRSDFNKEKSGGFDKRDRTEKRDGFQKRDGFERRNGFEKRDFPEKRNDFEKGDGFEKKDGFKKFNRNASGNERKFDDYGKSNKNFNESRSSDEGFTKPKSRDFKKDGSEKSWSDASEKSWKKGPKSFNKQSNSKFGGSRKGFSPPSKTNEIVETDDWGTSAVATTDDNTNSNSTTYDYAAESDRFLTYNDLSRTNEMISISWFYNPIHFYCQLEKDKSEFREMMEELQTNYRKRQPGSAVAGAPVIVQFSEDGALYRAVVLSSQFNQYHVKYIDYGNVATVNKVYPIEKKYMKLPAQAILCGLRGIAPCSDNWPNPNTYSPYFDKDHFNCQFTSFLEDRYYIDLYHNKENVSTLLIEASLAISNESEIKIDTNLLVHQQIVVILRNATSLSDIILEIQPGVTVKASMHNFTFATETYEDTLKAWIGHYVIIFVDAVFEDDLEITLYDLTGQKLHILIPDEGAYDTVEPICPLPIYSNIMQGWVSYASVESIYVQPAKFADTITQLLETLYAHYSAMTQEEAITPAAGQIYAVLSSDSNWYRGSITEIKEDEVIVTFVDYGNSESVPVTNLRELSPQFYQPHMLAAEILISGDKEEYSEQKITLSVTYSDIGWKGEILVIENTPQPGQSEIEIETLIDVISTQQEQILEEIVPSSEVGVSVVISHIDSPSEFYIQLSDALESINILQQELQDQISSLADLENPTAGVLCAAPYSVCQQWFRAQVLDADDDITTVRFVDFGNTDVITNSNVRIKTLPTELLSIEYHAKLCSLFAKPIGEEWSGSAIDSFEEYTSVSNLKAEIVHQDEKTTYIELYANGNNVGEMMKCEGLAADLQMETESSSTGFISNLNSPSEFWIQLESSCSDLEWVAEQLSNANNYPALEDLTPGSLCAAIYLDDDSWYRARILSNTVAGLEVIFIDYGNSCSCSGLRELPEDLIMLPPLALKCSLQKPNGMLQWSSVATDKFKELSADGATIFNVNILTPGETCIVQLTHDGQDVSSRLAPETSQCFVTHVDSLESFWVQFMDNNIEIENMTAELENAESWPEISDVEENNLVAALHEDGTWYRANIIKKSDEGYEVLFIDYGNTSCVSNLRELPEECTKILPLASNFKLDVPPRTKWGENSCELFKKMTDYGVAIFDAETVSEKILRLYLNGVDIRSNLECVKCTPSVSLQSSPRKILTEPVQLTIPDVSEIDDTITKEVVSENEDLPPVETNLDFTEFLTCSIEITDEDNSTDKEIAEAQKVDADDTLEKISLIEEDEVVAKLEKIEDNVTLENNIDATKMVENHLDMMIENVVNVSEKKLQAGQELKDSERVETQLHESITGNCESEKVISNQENELKIDDTEPTQLTTTKEISNALLKDNINDETVSDKDECDISNQEVTSPITEPSVNDTSNLLTNPNEKITANTLECDKTVHVIKTDEKELLSEDNATRKTSDKGHSPKQASEEIPVQENKELNPNGDR